MKVGTNFEEKCNDCKGSIPAGIERVQDPRPGKGTWIGRDGKERPNVVHLACAARHTVSGNGNSNGNAAPIQKAESDLYGKLRHIRHALVSLLEEVDDVLKVTQEPVGSGKPW